MKAAASSRSRTLPERSFTAGLGTSRKIARGQIVVESAKTARSLEPAITLPADAVDHRDQLGGSRIPIVFRPANADQAGTIQMANFINPQGLLKIGEHLYEETEGSGCATTGSPGSSGSGIGKIRQGWIEQSNVDLRQELAEWKRIRQTCRTIRSLLEEQ